MKRILFLLFAGLPLMTWADPVSQQKAMQLAAQFLQSSQTRSDAVSLEMIYDGMDGASRASGESSPYFVFNNTSGGGFAIIAGEDAVMPVLAYSTESNIKTEGMPGNLRNWLGDVKDQIDFLREQGVKASPAVRRAWSRAASHVGDVVVKLETARWDQTAPYYNQTPVYNGRQCVTGCTNTALAIVMRYHKWPDRGQGTIPSYTIQGEQGVKMVVPSRTLGEKYDWNQMPLVYGQGDTGFQREQVARLMADVGTMNETNYGPSESGASFAYTLERLPVYMDYDKSLWMGDRDAYSTAEWHQILHGELDAKRPILYAGSDGKSGGHAFVLYGYTTDNYYLTNWGWGGNANGFFLLDAMAPEHGLNFSLNQYGLFGVKKNEGGRYTEDLLFSDSSLNVLVSHVKKAEPFMVSAGYMYLSNNSTDSESFTVSCWLTDAKGNRKEKISGDVVVKRTAEGYFDQRLGDFSCEIKEGFEAGDYICCFFKSKNTLEWKLIRGVWGNDYRCRILDANGDVGWLTKKVPMNYNKVTGILSFTLPEGFTMEVDESYGDLTNEHVSLKDGVFSVDTHALGKGTYFRFVIHEGERTKKIEVSL